MIRIRNLIPWLGVLVIVFTFRALLVSQSHSVEGQQLARRSDVYRQGLKRREATLIAADHWTEYQINQSSRRIRVLTNAVVSRRRVIQESEVDRPLEDPRLGWRYGVDYELLDASKNPIDQSTYHFRSQVEHWRDGETGELHFSVQLDRPTLAVAQTKVMQFANQSSAPPAYLRLRLGRCDQGIQRVYARVFGQVDRPEYDKTKTWVRMSKMQRERLCNNCVFSSELLSIDERQNLLRLMWLPAVKHNDFETETLYFLDRRVVSPEEIVPEPKPAGLLTDALASVSIQIPDQLGVIRIADVTLSEKDSTGTELPRDSIQIQYQSGDPFDDLSISRSIDRGREIQLSSNGGLLVLKSNQPARSLPTWSPSDSSDVPPIELFPTVTRSRWFVIDETPLVYDVHRLPNSPTPIRVLLRIPKDEMFSRQDFDPNGPDEFLGDKTPVDVDHDAIVTCELLTAEDDLVQSIKICCRSDHSTFDRLQMLGRTGSVSIATERYVSAASTVEKIRLTTDRGRVLASLANRPPGLDRVFRIEGEFAAEPHDGSVQPLAATRKAPPAWFPIRPRGYDDMISRNRSFLVSACQRPIQRDAKILAGQYQWFRFEPTGTWIGREAMIALNEVLGETGEESFESQQEQNGRGAQSQYRLLDRNRDWAFAAYQDKHVRSAGTAKLIVIADEPVGQVTIRVDGDVWVTREFSSRRGEIEFDRPLPDQGRIRIESDHDAMFFLRGCVVANAIPYRRRVLQSLDNGRLKIGGDQNSRLAVEDRRDRVTFDYEKLSGDDELVVVQFFRRFDSQANNDARSRLRISLQEKDSTSVSSQRALEDWTIRHRTYEIGALPKSDSIVLDSGQILCESATCFFPLKSDLPCGFYRLVIEELEKTSDGYVMVSQTIAGDAPQRYLHPKRLSRSTAALP